MRLLLTIGALLGVLFILNGCMATKAAWDHYDECGSQTSSFTAMVACGKQKRIAYCKETGQCGSMGNSIVQYADALAQSVNSGGMSEPEAKRRFIEFKTSMQSNLRRDQAIVAAGVAASGPTSCTKIGNTINCF